MTFSIRPAPELFITPKIVVNGAIEAVQVEQIDFAELLNQLLKLIRQLFVIRLIVNP
jgi:hypothetical protein